MHRFVVKFSKFSSPQAARGIEYTRPDPYTRVRVGSGKCFTGTGIPAFTREKSSQITQLTITNNPKLTKSRILPQLLVKSVFIPLQISTLRTGTTHLWLSGSRITLASRNWRSSLEMSIRFRRRRTRANERSVQLDT